MMFSRYNGSCPVAGTMSENATAETSAAKTWKTRTVRTAAL